MKNYCILSVIFFLILTNTIAQSNSIDSLKHELTKTSSDEVRFGIYNHLGDLFDPFFSSDSAMHYYELAGEIAKKNDQRLLNGLCATKIALCAMFSLDVINAFDSIQKAFDLVEDRHVINGKYWEYNKISPDTLKLSELGWLNWIMGHLQRDKLSNINESINYFHQGQKLALEAKDSMLLSFCNGSIIYSFLKKNIPDSALRYGKALDQTAGYSINNDIFSYIRIKPDKYPFYLKDIGIAYLTLNNKPAFLQYLWSGIDLANKEDDIGAVFACYLEVTKFYLSEKNKDSSFYYAKKAQQCAPDYYPVYQNLYKYYELENQPDSVAKYMKLTLSGLNESHNSQLEDLKVVQRTSFQKQLQLQALEKKKIESEGKWKTFSIGALILVFSIIGFLLYRNNIRQRKARALIEQSYSRLESTQAQLIQSEKMASLGALTAGIAHEIQNPLNFVNNFSEVNKELIAELVAEIEKGNYDSAKAIAEDITGNQEKINHHGKRADSIVKGMLQHARTTGGQKEPTDINVLADEYIRLAYHGMRTKDNSFNAIPIAIGIDTNFDSSIEKINIVPQEIGRVILNLLNNAFYAVSAKASLAKADSGYEPRIVVSTKKLGSKVELAVKDNGNGVPQNIIDKIFQPFFTTKPTGQGTGLGLSLAYDIVKAHGGEIKVETKEARPDDPVGRGNGLTPAAAAEAGTEFIIYLPTDPIIKDHGVKT